MVGDKELNNNTVNVRTRDNVVHGEVSVEQLLVKFKELKDSKVLEDVGKF